MAEKKKMKFEDALQRLEEIVEELEAGELSLDASLARFEEGVKLTRLCRNKLDQAQRKVEILLKDENGELQRAPFDEESDGAQGPPANDDLSAADSEKDDDPPAGESLF